MVGGSDKINPSMLISSDMDFANFEFFQATDNLQSQPPSDFESPAASDKENVNHRNGRTHNPTKRKNLDGLSDILASKWAEDKEMRLEREKKEEERTERSERRADELLDIMNRATDALTRIAELG